MARWGEERCTHLGTDEVERGGFDLLHLHTGTIQMPLIVRSLEGGEKEGGSKGFDPYAAGSAQPEGRGGGVGFTRVKAVQRHPPSLLLLAPLEPPLQHSNTQFS